MTLWASAPRARPKFCDLGACFPGLTWGGWRATRESSRVQVRRRGRQIGVPSGRAVDPVGRPPGVVPLGEAEAGEIGDPQVGQIARASSSKVPTTRKVTGSSTPSS
jgi:hypothetical protein